MYCAHCGKMNVEGSVFCADCGHRLTHAADTVSGGSVHVAPEFHTQKGCVGQAWSDITGSPNWVKRVLTLMVMNCVPVLNLFVSGYSFQWGAEAASGKPKPLEKGTFSKKTFVLGLIALLLGILLSMGVFPFAVFSFIPFVGIILMVVANWFATAFCYLSMIRVGVVGKLGAAFDLSELFRTYRKNLGGLFAAAVVPGLIACVIVVVIAVILLFIAWAGGAAAFGSSAYPSYSYDYMYGYDYSYGYGSYSSPYAILAFLGGFTVGVIFIIALALFLGGLANLWSMRAVGHWVKRNAPQWASEAAASVCAGEPAAASAGFNADGAAAAPTIVAAGVGAAASADAVDAGKTAPASAVAAPASDRILPE